MSSAKVTRDMDIQEIKDKGQVVAIVWRKRLKAKGARFLTPQNYTLQVGLLEHPKGKKIPAHRHPNIKYNVGTTQEFLYIESGQVETTLYRDNWSVIRKLKLNAGDFILTVSGGHGFKVLKPARIIEIKQGPYPGDAKAKIFLGADGKDSRTRPTE